MNDITAETLKDKLNSAINKRMLILKQGKTEAVNAIAVPLEVQPRQIYKWLNAESFPHNAGNLALALDTMINDLDKNKSDIRDPGPRTAPMNFPFQVFIPRNTLKVTQDEHGNITIRGQLSVDLI